MYYYKVPTQSNDDNWRVDEPDNNRPNILFIMVDEERFPPPYEDDSIRSWRKENLKAQNFLKQHGVEFLNHYAGSTACSPSRTTLYTGQYPSLHGVSQTDGGGSTAFGPDMFWLDPSTLPTFGDYLRLAGYQTFWKGKWHASHADIIVPGTQNSFLSYEQKTGVPIPENEEIYSSANRLGEFGFDGWIGPEPHGSSPHNSGASAAEGVSGRDVVYAQEVVELIENLQKKDSKQPWAIVASFVNPHDIALFGAYTRLLPAFNFDIDPSVPSIPPSPTAKEDLSTKPHVQEEYRRIYPQLIQPLADTETYRRLYYSLQLEVDQEINRVLEALVNSIFYEDTIIIYTSDHGDMLGSHGGLFQKWYQAYEESIHVPLIIHNPRIVAERKRVDTLTSHVDIMPTLLDLAGIDVDEALVQLKRSHTEAHPLVGRSLIPFIFGEGKFEDQPIYFMTDDDPSKNFEMLSTIGGKTLEPVKQPSHIETVIVKLPTGEEGQPETWKYSRYFDNPQFWSDPGDEDVQTTQGCSVSTSEPEEYSLCITRVKTNAIPDQFEMYNITRDPIEEQNLANPKFSTPESEFIKVILENLLIEECKRKRLYPSSGDVPGKPSCGNSQHDFLNL